jgi:hypothetical protein
VTELGRKIASLTSQLNEARNKLSESHSKLSEEEKNYKLLSGEQCNELIITSNYNQEKLLQRRVSNATYL